MEDWSNGILGKQKRRRGETETRGHGEVPREGEIGGVADPTSDVTE